MSRTKAMFFHLAVSCFISSVFGGFYPDGGCSPLYCRSYESVAVRHLIFRDADYSQPTTWQKGDLPKAAFVLGKFNPAILNAVLDVRFPGFRLPALNLERYDLETDAVDGTTGKPYATPSPETNIADCCTRCAVTQGCRLFQFFPSNTSQGSACFLLTGGSDTSSLPGYGSPYAGTADDQNVGSRKNLPLSFVGGLCNGSVVAMDDPHFTGDDGVEFDFHGQVDKSYCLVTDSDFQINAFMHGYVDNRTTEGAHVGSDGAAVRTWMREVAFFWKNNFGTHTLHMVARATPEQDLGTGLLANATLDGRPLNIPKVPNQVKRIGDMKITYLDSGLRGDLELEHMLLQIENKMEIEIGMRVAWPEYQTPTDAMAHFDLFIYSLGVSHHLQALAESTGPPLGVHQQYHSRTEVQY